MTFSVPSNKSKLFLNVFAILVCMFFVIFKINGIIYYVYYRSNHVAGISLLALNAPFIRPLLALWAAGDGCGGHCKQVIVLNECRVMNATITGPRYDDDLGKIRETSLHKKNTCFQ